MKLPTQAKPVAHTISSQGSVNGIAPSDCGCPIACIGGCVFGKCIGLCI